jgi:hypothetical protein
MAQAIKIDTFGGMIPAVDDRLLPGKAAAHSENAWLYSGALTGVPQPTFVRTCAPGTVKVFRLPASYDTSTNIYDSSWLEFTNADTDVIRSPVVNDSYDRYYWASSSLAPLYNTKERIERTHLNDEYTKVLLHFNGTDASTTITDTNVGGSAHTWTANGNAQLDTAVKQFGTAALLCDGTGDYVSTPDHADFNLGSGDFTIDLWFNCTAAAAVGGGLAGQCDAVPTASTMSFFIERDPTDLNIRAFFGFNGVSLVSLTSTTTFTDAINTGWHHLAVVRSGDTVTLYIDGVAEDTDALVGTVNNSTDVLAVGRPGDYGSLWTGSIDEFRLSVGIARWTANFDEDLPDVEHASKEPWLLGIPAPSVVPSVSPSGGTGADTTRAYVYTWVSAYGEEGPPSEPTTVTGQVDDTWAITLTAAAGSDLGDDGDDRYLTLVRIYRTVTSSAGVATYFFVAEQAISDTTYDDSASDATVAANDQLESTNWTAPPSDLQGFIRMPNGIVASWRESEIWFSEPYRPHAWPAAYVVTVDYPVVGLGVTGQRRVQEYLQDAPAS